MKGITKTQITNKKWKATIALVALFALTSCSQVPVDNGGSSGGGGGNTGGGGTTTGGGNTGGGTGTGGGNTGGGTGTGGGNTGGGTGTGGGNTGGGNTGGGTGGGTVAPRYVVQLLATSDLSKAQTVKSTFTSEGYQNININTVTINGQSIHRVQVGLYGTPADGNRVLAQMKRRYHKNQYVNSAVVKTVYGK